MVNIAKSWWANKLNKPAISNICHSTLNTHSSSWVPVENISCLKSSQTTVASGAKDIKSEIKSSLNFGIISFCVYIISALLVIHNTFSKLILKDIQCTHTFKYFSDQIHDKCPPITANYTSNNYHVYLIWPQYTHMRHSFIHHQFSKQCVSMTKANYNTGKFRTSSYEQMIDNWYK